MSGSVLSKPLPFPSLSLLVSTWFRGVSWNYRASNADLAERLRSPIEMTFGGAPPAAELGDCDIDQATIEVVEQRGLAFEPCRITSASKCRTDGFLRIFSRT